MREIRKLVRDMRENVSEAKHKIHTAYELKSSYPAMAVWYKDMAAAHLGFNDTGHQIVVKLISDYRASDAYKKDAALVDAMIPIWDAEHADIMEETAYVRTEISMFK